VEYYIELDSSNNGIEKDFEPPFPSEIDILGRAIINGNNCLNLMKEANVSNYLDFYKSAYQ